MPIKRTYRLNADAILAVRNLQNVIRVKFPGDPDFDDVLAFDPESDTPQPAVEEKIRKMMGDTADSMGLDADIAHAIRKTGLLITDRGKHLLDDDQLSAWNEAIDEYVRLSKRPQ
jgi:hypothetical protein